MFAQGFINLRLDAEYDRDLAKKLYANADRSDPVVQYILEGPFDDHEFAGYALSDLIMDDLDNGFHFVCSDKNESTMWISVFIQDEEDYDPEAVKRTLDRLCPITVAGIIAFSGNEATWAVCFENGAFVEKNRLNRPSSNADKKGEASSQKTEVRTISEVCRALLPEEKKPVNATFELFGNQFWIVPKNHRLDHWQPDTDYLIESGNNWFTLEVECSPVSGKVTVTRRTISRDKRTLRRCHGSPDVLAAKIEAAFMAAIIGSDVGLQADEMPKVLPFYNN